jgi:ABC-type polysaccharide/polyol phosphate transport system ATPase subunit
VNAAPVVAPAVVVDDVTVRYRMYRERNNSVKTAIMRGRRGVHEDFVALEGISLEVPKGATFGIVGRNGAGKSTLLKCLARILYPDSGSITIDGRMASMLELGSGFHPELSGRENVYLNASILGMPRKAVAAKFDEIVAFAGVGKFIDQPIKNYSSGMYVRLGFSVAINVNPDILVVDEILAVGDAAFKEKSRAKFAELKDSGKTVIMVTHSITNIHEMCDLAAWIDGGKLKAIGNADEVADAYAEAIEKGDDHQRR